MVRVFQIILAVGFLAAVAAPYGPYLLGAGVFALSHLLFPVVLLVVYGIIFGMIGADYGLPGLFWHDRLRTRLGAATAATLLVALTGILSFYAFTPPDHDGAAPVAAAVDALIARIDAGSSATPAKDSTERVARFLLVASPPFVLLLIAPAIFPAAFPRVPRWAPEVLIRRDKPGPAAGSTMSVASNPAAYGLGLVTWLGGIALGIFLVFVLLWLARAVGGWTWLGAGDDGLTSRTRSLAMFTAAFVLFYGILSTRPVYERIVSPAFAICSFLGLATTAYALIAYLLPWSFPGAATLVFIGGVFWFGFVNNKPYKLRFPEMEAYYPGGTPGLVPLRQRVDGIVHAIENSDDASGSQGIRDVDALNNWVKLAGAGEKPKLAVIAVSGGALRSGLWVAVVLDRLEKQIPRFGRHVRVITGASGGMLGAANYLVHRRNAVNEPETVDSSGSYRPSDWVLSIPRDSLDPVARFLALRDPLLAFLPRVVDDDRGIRLENAWKAIAIPFRSLRPDEEAGRIPSMILSPMIIEDGRRLLISNLELQSITASTGIEIPAEGQTASERLYSLSAVEFYRLFPAATGFKLNTGVRMNASFPYVSPSVSLPTDPPRRVFDAGVYDNYGVQVASAWIHKNFDWVLANTSGVVLVQIRDSISVDARRGVAEAPMRFLDRLLRGFQFFTSAPEAAESARTASANFRNDEDIAALSDRFAAAKSSNKAFFTTVVFENSAEVTYRSPLPGSWPGDEHVDSEIAEGVALNWYLTRAERDSLISAIPVPTPGGQWVDRERRLGRITELKERAAAATGMARVSVLTQLEQAENFERLVQLEAWWRNT
jgi:hypothetical protein